VVLRRAFPERGEWIVTVGIAHALGGLLGAAIGLPFGSLIFGLLTGWAIRKVMSEEGSRGK